jgi:multisubunit Na+/H+ antiporter MnhG subunit
MTDLLIDAVMFTLLVLSVGFAGIGVIGLLVFPDIRSRMYTATRAPVISICAMIVAVTVYALSMILSGGGDLYLALFMHVLVLLCIVVAANMLMYRIIRGRTKTMSACEVSSEQPEKRK